MEGPFRISKNPRYCLADLESEVVKVQVNCATCLLIPFQATVHAYQGLVELCGWRILGTYAYEREKLKMDSNHHRQLRQCDYKFLSSLSFYCLLASIVIDFFDCLSAVSGE